MPSGWDGLGWGGDAGTGGGWHRLRMSDSVSDDVYQPEGGGADLHPEPDLQNSLDDRDADDVLDEGYSPPEKARGLNAHGTTLEEQREGETLDQRLAQEVPDVTDDPGDGLGEDTEKDAVAYDVGIDGGAAGAEEAAMHIVDEDDIG